MAHQARYAAAMKAVTSRLPFGLSAVIEPSMLGYLLINLCTFFIDLALLAVFHGRLRWPIPIAVTCSYGTASVISYIANRVLNFRSHADVGRQFPVYVAVSVSNYLIFVLGLTDLLSAAGVYYEISRVIAACCEGVYLYCMMRWVVFRDVSEGSGSGGSAAPGDSAGASSAGGDLSPPGRGPGPRRRASRRVTGQRPGVVLTGRAPEPQPTGSHRSLSQRLRRRARSGTRAGRQCR